MTPIQWRRAIRGSPVTHAFEVGRRFSVCGKAQRVAEADWAFSTASSSCICLGCVRYLRHPPTLDSLRGLIDIH